MGSRAWYVVEEACDVFSCWENSVSGHGSVAGLGAQSCTSKIYRMRTVSLL